MKRNISRRKSALRKPSLSLNVRLGLRAIARKFEPRDDYDQRAIAWIHDTIAWYDTALAVRKVKANRRRDDRRER